MAKETYTIKVTRPPGVSVQDMKDYLKEAAGGWKGQFSPEDPRFDIKVGFVSRMRVEEENGKGK